MVMGPTRNGRNKTRYLAYAGKVYIATQFAFVIAVHAYVNHHCAGFYHVGGEYVALTYSGHNHICLQRHGFEVCGCAVANGDCGALLQ